MNPFDKLIGAVYPAIPSLTEEQKRKLARLKNRTTLYEAALVKGDQRMLFCYTRQTGRGVHDYMRTIRDTKADSLKLLKQNTGIDLTTWDWNGWTVEFTGRTQREAIINGELKFWADSQSETENR
jgi:hypothetical protein